MTDLDPDSVITRRRALALGGLAGGVAWVGGASADAASCRPRRYETTRGHLPVKRIEEIVGAEGTVTDRVLGIAIARDDIGKVKGPEGVTFDSDFQIHGDLAFQPLGADRAFSMGTWRSRPPSSTGSSMRSRPTA